MLDRLWCWFLIDAGIQSRRLWKWLADCYMRYGWKLFYFYQLCHHLGLYCRTLSNYNKVRDIILIRCVIKLKWFSIFTKKAVNSRNFYNSQPFRNAALGSCSLVARIGGVLSNIVGKLAEYHVAIPTTIFGISALLSAFLSLFLPETAGHSLPDTIEECEKEFKNKSRRASHQASRRCSTIPK